MNITLFKSVHAFFAAGILIGFWLWNRQSMLPFGREANLSAIYLLWSGWVALILYIIVVLYSLRKYVHKLGWSPEILLKAPVQAIENTKKKLSHLRTQILAGELANKSEIQKRALAVLKEEKVYQVLRLKIRKGVHGKPRFIIELHPKEPLARLSKWMHAHLFYGLTSAGLVWLHGGGNFESWMGLLLNGLSYLVIITGLIGIVFWTFGPSWLTDLEKDLTIEKASVLRNHFKKKVEECSTGLSRDVLSKFGSLSWSPRKFTIQIKSFLKEHADAQDLEDLSILMGQQRLVEREWRFLSRARFWLNLWRFIHVPAAIVLMVVVLIHVISIWWY